MQTKGPYDFAGKRKQYRGQTMEALLYAAKDIVDTISIWRAGGGYHPNEGWYMDDLATVKEEINRRRVSHACPTCGK